MRKRKRVSVSRGECFTNDIQKSRDTCKTRPLAGVSQVLKKTFSSSSMGRDQDRTDDGKDQDIVQVGSIDVGISIIASD
jgi:hypothetical protein